MVTSALTTTREALVAVDAAWNLHKAMPLMRRPYLSAEAAKSDHNWEPSYKVESLQTSVRAALVEMELLRPVQFKQNAKKGWAALEVGAKRLVTISELDKSVFDAQLALVEAFAALRAERTAEVLTQVVPQIAHWSSVVGLSPERHRFTLELLGIGLRFAMMMVMQFKYAFNVPRAATRSAVVQPMVLTPGYTAYPSGHATEASFAAELLPLLVGDPSHPIAGQESFRGRADGMARQLNRLALRIAENRVVAGLHFPVDTIAGQVLGVMLARYLVWLSSDTMFGFDWRELKVGAHAFHKPSGLKGAEILPYGDSFVDEQREVKAADVSWANESVPDAPVLRDLWRLARREWVGP